MSARAPPSWPAELGDEPWWWQKLLHVYEHKQTVLDLRHFDASRPVIGDEGMKVLAERGLPSVPEVTKLSLWGNHIGDDGLQVLAERGLPHVPKLTDLYLGGNRIGAEGLKVLAKRGLASVPNLLNLSLGDNHIGADGAKVLAERGLQHVPKLTNLSLRSNGIGDRGLKVLAKRGLRNVPQLTNLDLSHNDIGEDGAKVFAKELAANVLPILTGLGGVDLHDHLDVMQLPGVLGSATNKDILKFIHERAQGVALLPPPCPQDDGGVRMAVAKVMVIGPGAAGKTTLIHHFVSGGEFLRDVTMTDGMEMCDWTIGGMELRFYDFGGQEVYTNTHRLFLGTKGVFVLVWHPPDQDRLISEYARDALDCAPDAHLVFVSTHAHDQRSSAMTSARLKTLVGARCALGLVLPAFSWFLDVSFVGGMLTRFFLSPVVLLCGRYAASLERPSGLWRTFKSVPKPGEALRSCSPRSSTWPQRCRT
eukprot:scaffold1955_cov254-Pinguiococcus_pyrenoidosus.AAC.8